MGIPYYFYTLTKSYNNILTEKIPIDPDIYCIDFNGVIHPLCHQEIQNENFENEKIIKKLYEKVVNDIKDMKPSKTIICVDGVVPIAKMFQQRKRRYLSVLKNKIDNITIKWDTNAITPGTEFMNSLNQYFKKQIRYDENTIVYNGSDEYGEGEHKIFALLENEKEDINVIINGLDADLIILSLMSHRKNIYLMRESDLGKTYVNINNLRIAVINEVCKKWNISIPLDYYDIKSYDIIESYCVMCSLLGNDFVPHLLTLNMKNNGLDTLINVTKNTYNTNGLLVENSTINYSALSDILQNLAKTEDKDLYIETEKYIKKNPHQSKIDSDAYGIKHKEKVAYEFYSDISKWRMNYYKYLFNTNICMDSSTVSLACENYIKGIYWTYLYYKKKDCDNTWYYPYNYPPSVRDIANYVICNTEPIIQSKKTNLTSDIQLLIVLPKESKNLLKQKYQKYMEDQTLGLCHLYPSSYTVHTFLKTQLWECSPVLPHINVDYLMKIVK